MLQTYIWIRCISGKRACIAVGKWSGEASKASIEKLMNAAIPLTSRNIVGGALYFSNSNKSASV